MTYISNFAENLLLQPPKVIALFFSTIGNYTESANICQTFH